jgi:hypothetical protein
MQDARFAECTQLPIVATGGGPSSFETAATRPPQDEGPYVALLARIAILIAVRYSVAFLAHILRPHGKNCPTTAYRARFIKVV